MGKGALAPLEMCKVFCALAVTVRRSVDQFMRLGGSFNSFVAYVLRATSIKGRQLF